MRKTIIALGFLLALPGCLGDDQQLHAPSATAVLPIKYANIPSVLNRLKCDILAELQNNPPGTTWAPSAVSGTLELSTVHDRSTEGDLGFSIPIGPAKLGAGAKVSLEIKDTGKFEIDFGVPLNAGPDVACAGEGVPTPIAVTPVASTPFGKKPNFVFPGTRLVRFANMATTLKGVDTDAKNMSVKSVKYSGAFEIKQDAKENLNVDFVIIKIGDATHDASADYAQSFTVTVTYAADAPKITSVAAPPPTGFAYSSADKQPKLDPQLEQALTRIVFPNQAVVPLP